jgi:hypothetical protein
MPPAVRIRNALSQLFLLGGIDVIQINIIQQSLLYNLSQDLFFDALRIRRHAEQ